MVLDTRNEIRERKRLLDELERYEKQLEGSDELDVSIFVFFQNNAPQLETRIRESLETGVKIGLQAILTARIRHLKDRIGAM